jgi:hypothetical protein
VNSLGVALELLQDRLLLGVLLRQVAHVLVDLVHVLL